MASKILKEEEAHSPPPPYSATGPSYQQDVESPPNYQDASRHYSMDPPPTYDSLYGRMKSARAESHGNVDFAKRLCTIVVGTNILHITQGFLTNIAVRALFTASVGIPSLGALLLSPGNLEDKVVPASFEIGCTIMLGVIMAVPVAMIIIGAIYKNDCKAEYYIPIYLIVAGSFGIVKNLSSLLQRCMNKDKENADERNAKTNPFDSTLNCFLFAWFIAGNVWIYRTYNHWSPDPLVGNYCHPTLYYFAFWVTTATYILLGTVCCCTCCLGIGVAIFGEKE